MCHLIDVPGALATAGRSSRTRRGRPDARMLRTMQPALAYGLVTLLSATAGIATFQAPREPTGRELARAAVVFLDSLSPALRTQATAGLDDPRRQQWSYLPQEYPGVKLQDLDAMQKSLAEALLHKALSASGYGKVKTIRLLEQVLHDQESTPGHEAVHRDPARYWFLVYGDPKAGAAWSMAVQGHHVALHLAVVGDDVVATTPFFLGANPHEVQTGPQKGQRALGHEEDKARALLAALDEEQTKAATLPIAAPADVILGPQRAADFLGEPQGVAYSAMNGKQQALLWALLREYADNLPVDVADSQLLRIEAKGRGGIHFAWAGSVEKGKGHYWRLHGKTFVIEYDNTQNDANHVHTVWRDLTSDFGGDLLREHVEHDHR